MNLNQIGWLAAIIAFVLVGSWIYFTFSKLDPKANPTVQSNSAVNSKNLTPPGFKPAKVKPLDMNQVEMDPDLKVQIVKDELLVTLNEADGRTQLEKILGLVDPMAKIVGEIPAVNMFQVQVNAKLKRGTQSDWKHIRLFDRLG